MFFSKKKARKEYLLSAAVELRGELQRLLGDAWYVDIDYAFPCRVSEGDGCETGHHPGVLVRPYDQIMKEQYREKSEGWSKEKAPNMAVLYGHYSSEIGVLTFYLHDFQATISSDFLLPYGSRVFVDLEPKLIPSSILKIRRHFENYLI
jgi:hypothetical protein